MYCSFIKFLRKVWLIIFISLFINNITFAQKTDVVDLKNGDKITGEIKYLKVGILNLSTDNMETINIKWDKIKSITTTNKYQVEINDGRVYFGNIEPSKQEGNLIIKGVVIDIDLYIPNIVRINPLKESFWDILDGYIKIGFSFTKASKISQLSVGGNAKYRTKINLSEVILNSVITTTEDKSSSINQNLSFNYQHNLDLSWFGSGIISLEENTELGIKLRTSIGGGIGNNFVQSTNEWVYALGGLLVNREWKIDNSTPVNNIEGLVNVQYQHFKYDHPKMNILTYIYLLPSLSDLGRFRFSYNAQVSWEIFLDFYWDLSFYYEYDNGDVSVNSSNSDYRIDTSVKYEF